MKIAIDARIIATGTGRYVERLIHYLEQIDNTNHYFILVRKKDLEYYKPANPNFQVIEADFADYSFGEQLGLAKLLYSLKVDLVHFCMPQQPLLYFKPSVTTVHDLNLLRITSNDDMGKIELFIKKIIFGLLLFLVSRKSRHILAISEYTKKDLLRFSRIKSQKVTRTYEGADTTTYPPKPVKHLVGQPFIMYVGRAEPYKNNRRMIAAHQQLLEHFPDLRLVIVGKIDVLRKADMAWAKKLGAKQVDFMGFVSNEELAWLYPNSQGYVAPSTMEGFGLPGLEAQAAGAPLISSNTTCSPEVFGDGARYFDPLSTHDMVRAIGEVVGNKALQKELIAKGRQQVKKYSWRAMAEQTLVVYKKAAKN